MYLEEERWVLMRQNRMIAELIATLKNVVGGKPDKDKDTESVPLDRLYQWWECMPPEFLPDDFELEAGLSAEAAKDFMKHLSGVPQWALQLIDMDAVKAAAS